MKGLFWTGLQCRIITKYGIKRWVFSQPIFSFYATFHWCKIKQNRVHTYLSINSDTIKSLSDIPPLWNSDWRRSWRHIPSRATVQLGRRHVVKTLKINLWSWLSTVIKYLVVLACSVGLHILFGRFKSVSIDFDYFFFFWWDFLEIFRIICLKINVSNWFKMIPKILIFWENVTEKILLTLVFVFLSS